MSEKSIIDQIKHYQRDIVKCPNDSKRMIRCIERLTVLPITIAHLQETGVGRSVNELRKCGGEVGAAASSLVFKWKSMVKDSDSEEDSEVEESVEHVKSSTNHKRANSNERTESSQKLKKPHSSDYHKKPVSSHNSHSKTESRHRDVSKDSSNHHKSSSRSSEKSHRDSSNKSGSHSQKHKTDNTSSSHKTTSGHDSESDHNGRIDKNTKLKYEKSKSSKYNSDSVSSNSKLKNNKHEDYKDKHRKEDKLSNSKSSKKYDLKRIESDSSDDEVYKPSRKKLKTEDSDEEQSYKTTIKHHKPSGKKRDSSDESDSRSESEEENDNDKKMHVESGDSSDSDNRNNSADNISDDEPAGSAKDSENVSEASERDSEENNSETDNESPEEEEYVPVKIKKEKPEREFKSYSTNEKHHSNHTKNKYIPSSKVKNHIKLEKDDEVKIKKEKDDKNRTNSVNQRDVKDGKNEKHHKGQKTRTLSESSSKEHKSDKKVKVKIEKEDDGSIDCVSGASFADALMGLSDSKKKPTKKKTSSPSIEKQSRSGEKSSSSKDSKVKSSSKHDGRPSTSSSSSSKTSFKELDLLSKNIKLEPLDVDLKATLPEITPNYKPLPHFSPPASPPNKRAKFISQEDALSTIMSTKNQRTKVFSGNKTGFTKVPSLFDLCIQVLQNNIEGLEYTGGVPYDLLKPVLDRATADQLHQLEYYNPYLVEDTDSLWKFHCKKEFRGKEPEEFETWRELYLRSLDERERKLKALKENITQSIAKSTPIRQTKLAYIDSVVKPPRNVARQQLKMGTGKAVKHEIVSKAMVGAASGSPTSGAVAVPAPPRTNSSQFPIPNFLKKKKAPLMAKALQLIKGNRFKR